MQLEQIKYKVDKILDLYQSAKTQLQKGNRVAASVEVTIANSHLKSLQLDLDDAIQQQKKAKKNER